MQRNVIEMCITVMQDIVIHGSYRKILASFSSIKLDFQGVQNQMHLCVMHELCA